VQSSTWDEEMIAIFGTKNLDDDYLTEEEGEVVDPSVPGLSAQPSKKNRNTFRSPKARRKKLLRDVGREAKMLIKLAWKATGELLVKLPQSILIEVLSSQRPSNPSITWTRVLLQKNTPKRKTLAQSLSGNGRMDSIALR
jgi:hypothetical protein